MLNDNSPKGYPLPHPENIAAKDVTRIRNALMQIDADITEQNNQAETLKKQIDRMRFEARIDFEHVFRTYALTACS